MKTFQNYGISKHFKAYTITTNKNNLPKDPKAFMFPANKIRLA